MPRELRPLVRLAGERVEVSLQRGHLCVAEVTGREGARREGGKERGKEGGKEGGREGVREEKEKQVRNKSKRYWK